jgi:hypothetical protein
MLRAAYRATAGHAPRRRSDILHLLGVSPSMKVHNPTHRPLRACEDADFGCDGLTLKRRVINSILF